MKSGVRIEEVILIFENGSKTLGFPDEFGRP
jgi:hypothetical protein